MRAFCLDENHKYVTEENENAANGLFTKTHLMRRSKNYKANIMSLLISLRIA